MLFCKSQDKCCELTKYSLSICTYCDCCLIARNNRVRKLLLSLPIEVAVSITSLVRMSRKLPMAFLEKPIKGKHSGVYGMSLLHGERSQKVIQSAYDAQSYASTKSVPEGKWNTELV